MIGAQPTIEIIAKENMVTILDHEVGKKTEEIVEDPMTVPRRIMDGWTPQLVDDLPDAFCGESSVEHSSYIQNLLSSYVCKFM